MHNVNLLYFSPFVERLLKFPQKFLRCANVPCTDHAATSTDRPAAMYSPCFRAKPKMLHQCRVGRKFQQVLKVILSSFHHLYPQAFCTLSSFARIKRPGLGSVGLCSKKMLCLRYNYGKPIVAIFNNLIYIQFSIYSYVMFSLFIQFNTYIYAIFLNPFNLICLYLFNSITQYPFNLILMNSFNLTRKNIHLISGTGSSHRI